MKNMKASAVQDKPKPHFSRIIVENNTQQDNKSVSKHIEDMMSAQTDERDGFKQLLPALLKILQPNNFV